MQQQTHATRPHIRPTELASSPFFSIPLARSSRSCSFRRASFSTAESLWDVFACSVLELQSKLKIFIVLLELDAWFFRILSTISFKSVAFAEKQWGEFGKFGKKQIELVSFDDISFIFNPFVKYLLFFNQL
ncbi:MAG: hypothetical protein V4489_02300 [Chlamydiota bacterium]